MKLVCKYLLWSNTHLFLPGRQWQRKKGFNIHSRWSFSARRRFRSSDCQRRQRQRGQNLQRQQHFARPGRLDRPGDNFFVTSLLHLCFWSCHKNKLASVW